MPRKPRHYVPGIPCHVIQRGNNRDLISNLLVTHQRGRKPLRGGDVAIIRRQVKRGRNLLIVPFSWPTLPSLGDPLPDYSLEFFHERFVTGQLTSLSRRARWLPFSVDKQPSNALSYYCLTPYVIGTAHGEDSALV